VDKNNVQLNVAPNKFFLYTESIAEFDIGCLDENEIGKNLEKKKYG